MKTAQHHVFVIFFFIYQLGKLRINKEFSSFLIHCKISLHDLMQDALDSNGPKIA